MQTLTHFCERKLKLSVLQSRYVIEQAVLKYGIGLNKGE